MTDMPPPVTTKPRAPRPPWEAQVISGCVTLITVVATICIVIAIIAVLLFGMAQLGAHWPT
jgi:hypothetical protein